MIRTDRASPDREAGNWASELKERLSGLLPVELAAAIENDPRLATGAAGAISPAA